MMLLLQVIEYDLNMNLSLFILRLKKIFHILRSKYLFTAFFKYRVAPAIEHKSIFSIKYKTVVDIGSNNGQFSLVTKYFLPNVKIFAFDPLKSSKQKYNNLFKKDKKINFFNVAIGSKIQKKNFFISNKDDSSSLLPIGLNQLKNYPNTFTKSQGITDVVPLSKVLNRYQIDNPALLKIDVQGYELEVLKGSKNLIKEFDYIYCECSFIELYYRQPLVGEIINWLARNNFEMIEIKNISYDSKGNSIQADFFFKKIKKIN